MIIKHVIDGVEIPLHNWDNIAISISGGADSAVLSYIICKLIEKYNYNTTIHFINHIRMWKTKPWQEYDCLRVLGYLKKSFPNIVMQVHTSFIAPELEYGSTGPNIMDEYGKLLSGDNIQKRAFAEYVSTYNNVKCYYSAVTKNPPVHFNGAMSERNIVKTSENGHLELIEHMGAFASHPLRFVDKSWVVRQYLNYDILELFHMTRSCEGEIQGIDYTNYTPDQNVDECGKCFWCLERDWAKRENDV
jgi:hypothetical protein